jgi:hypothetical protein
MGGDACLGRGCQSVGGCFDVYHPAEANDQGGGESQPLVWRKFGAREQASAGNRTYAGQGEALGCNLESNGKRRKDQKKSSLGEMEACTKQGRKPTSSTILLLASSVSTLSTIDSSFTAIPGSSTVA